MKKTIGIIGLGKMGGNLALSAAEKGYTVIGYDKSLPEELKGNSAIQIKATLEEMLKALTAPMIIFIYIPAGKAVDMVIEQLSPFLQQGDIVVDGGNSYWGDSIKRAANLKGKGIYFLDCGTSGGISGARNGACFMVGGEAEAMEHVAPVFKSLAVENGFIHTGPPGSGHFVKLVHNGIEFGMLQAIGEGVELLTQYRDELNLSAILKVWNHGSVIRSWLIELMQQVYDKKQGFEAVPSYIEDTGEVNWLVADALRMEVPVPVIAQSVMQLFASRKQSRIADKAIAMMRHGFGGHPFGADTAIQYERKSGKVAGDETLYNRSS
jgi:6-phosphogluconate dehydrogenase